MDLALRNVTQAHEEMAELARRKKQFQNHVPKLYKGTKTLTKEESHCAQFGNKPQKRKGLTPHNEIIIDGGCDPVIEKKRKMNNSTQILHLACFGCEYHNGLQKILMFNLYHDDAT